MTMSYGPHTIVHLRQLDSIASAAAGQPVKVMVASPSLAALGQAEYAPAHKCFVIWLHPSLFSWRSSELTQVFYHEIGHIKAGHLDKSAKHWRKDGKPRVTRPDPRANSALGQFLLARREAQADQVGDALRTSWPYAAYSLFALLQGKEQYP